MYCTVCGLSSTRLAHHSPLVVQYIPYRIMSTLPTTSKSEEVTQQQVTKTRRPFNFTLWNKRHIALRIAYLGWDYSGLAVQESTDNTIEARLFECLMKTMLIEDPQTCNYSRCGRTDSGVSSLGQVVSLDVRTALLHGPGVIVTENSKATERKGDKETELPYLQMLNRILPSDIRVLSWAPVDPSFSARFKALYRIYKYYFPLGAMNIHIMKDAAKKFVGTHDFRNFCKMDIRGGVVNFERTIHGFTIEPIEEESTGSPYQVYECTVTGLGFLYHQIRCMMSILFLIGNGLEQPDIIDHMLDITKCPRKPQYGMATDYPLILYDCVFEDLNWIRDDNYYRKVLTQLQEQWTKQMMKATMIKRMLHSLSDDDTVVPSHQMSPLIKADHKLNGSYKSLLQRPSSDTFEERYEHHQAKKRKIEQEKS